MVQGIIIPADCSQSIVRGDFTEIGDYQRAVEGYVEAITIDAPRLALYVNEEGKLNGFAVNQRATVLWWYLVREARALDFIVGAVVVTPGNSRGGRELFALLATNRRCQVEFRAARTRGEWTAFGAVPYASWFEAASDAILLEEQASGSGAVRIIPV